MSATDLVKCPPPESINGGKHSCPTAMLVSKFGPPRERLTDDCAAVTSKFWKGRMVTKTVGPFRVTGHKLAVELLAKSLARVKEGNKALYDQLGSAGMLCCRRVRGSRNTLSNHGLGLAIDFTLGGHLDVRGDNLVQKGLIDLYGFLKLDGWWWGAEFSTEDAMHFEVSAEKIQEWINGGVF